MKLPRIPALPWWAQMGLQVGAFVATWALAELIDRKRKELTNASSQKADNDEEAALEGEWWCS